LKYQFINGKLIHMAWYWILLIVASVLLIGFIVALCFMPTKLWFRCLISGAHISMWTLIGMKIRKTKILDIVECYIDAIKSDIKFSVKDIENHYMAGGNSRKVFAALQAAQSAGVALTLQSAMAIDLAGYDVASAVQQSINPRITETGEITLVAPDGIEVILRARVTLRLNLNYAIGGAGEDTIIARMSEAIINIASNLADHTEVLKNPDYISAKVMERDLDAATAFDVVSIDIISSKPGRNVTAQIETENARKDKELAIAAAEKRRAMAVAEEAEMRARTQARKADLITAESEVPKAIADAFRQGHINVNDYYKLENLSADTGMRKSFIDEDNKK
jgi:uncharacterized protein YqfA (UPF0365 family)